MINDERIELFDSFMSDCKITKEQKQWLIQNGFFTAPASQKHHLSYEGGLFEHSLNVAMNLVQLTDDNKLTWQRPQSPHIVGMFHDLCKIDCYKWNPIQKKYEWNRDQTIQGHGSKSITLITKHLFELTEEERYCIRWHMGAFDEKENWQKYTDGIRKFNNVLWTHTADMLASNVQEME